MKQFADFQIDITGPGPQVYTTCPQCATTRKKKNAKCLSVNIENGIWNCHHCGWSGSLKFGDDKNSRPFAWKPKTYRKPEFIKSNPTEQLLAWFLKRGIHGDTVTRANIRMQSVYFPQLEDSIDAVVFPYHENKEVVNCKYRGLSQKVFRQEFDAKKILYGLDDVDADCLVIVEGEIDKLSCEEAGFQSCVSVPDGAPPEGSTASDKKFEYLANCQGILDSVKKIILAVDNDGPGKTLEQELARRLGQERCWRVVWPDGCKDANDVLVKHGPHTLSQCLSDAKPWPIDHVVYPGDLGDDLLALREQRESRGLSTGWKSVDELYTVMPGELTIVTGIPGHGKSEFIDALILNLAKQHGWGAAFCSPENLPVTRHLSKMLEKATGAPFYDKGSHARMTQLEMLDALEFLHQHIALIVPEESLTIQDLLAKAKGLVFQRGIRGLILDPWNEFDHRRASGLSETEHVSSSLGLLRRFARNHGVHVWVVAHPAKLQKNMDDKYPVPRPYDISGCHAEDTDVLTRRGWVKHSDVTLNDYVCCFDPEADKLHYARPEKIWRYDYSGTMLRIQSPSFDALVTPNHRLAVKPIRRSRCVQRVKYAEGWNFIEAKEVGGKSLEMPWATSFDDVEAYAITDAELKIMGWWVAEGWVTSGSIAFCQAVGPLADKMQRTLKESGLVFTSRVTNYLKHERPMWGARLKIRNDITTRTFAKMILNECGTGCANKKLPAWVWSMSIRQKEVLLHALIDGDGSAGREDSYRYATTSRRLANDVQRLSIEVGRMAVISGQPGVKVWHLPRYQVSIGRRSRRTISLRKSRHITEEHYTGPVFCLTVPGGAYLVRRNGKPGIYGNSAHWYNRADNCLSIWRDTADPEKRNDVEIHIQKIRNKYVGTVGMATLTWNYVCGTFSDGRCES